MNPTSTIDILRSLRLSAMADVYEASLRFTPAEAPSAGELLSRMSEAEWNQRQQRKIDRLLKQAGLRVPASLDRITFDPLRNLNADTVGTLSTMEWAKDGGTVLITGPTGVGKSFLACALGHEACLKGITTRYRRPSSCSRSSAWPGWTEATTSASPSSPGPACSSLMTSVCSR